MLRRPLLPGQQSVAQLSVLQLKKIDHRQLTWADFKGKASSKSKYDAATKSDCHDPEIGKNTPQADKLAAVDTGEACKNGKKDDTKFKVDIKIDPANIKVKAYMWQEKSWAKPWVKDQKAREKTCQSGLVKDCETAFSKSYAKIAEKRKKEAAKATTDCKKAFKEGSTAYTVTINDKEITANSAGECAKPLGTEVGKEYEAAAKKSVTWTAKMAEKEATVASKADCKTTFLNECANKLYTAAAAELLGHEQGHFDITNVLVGKIESALHNLIATFETEVVTCGEKQALTKAKKVLKANVSKLSKEYKKQYKALKKVQDSYDAETVHGKVVDKQAEWVEKIGEGLPKD